MTSAAIGVAHHAAQRAVQQPERLQRLAQVVARGGEKAALGEVGVIGVAARFAQRVLGALAFGDVADRGGDHRLFVLRDRTQADLDGELRAVASACRRVRVPRPWAARARCCRSCADGRRGARGSARAAAVRRAGRRCPLRDARTTASTWRFANRMCPDGVDDDHRVRCRIENAPDELGEMSIGAARIASVRDTRNCVYGAWTFRKRRMRTDYFGAGETSGCYAVRVQLSATVPLAIAAGGLACRRCAGR